VKRLLKKRMTISKNIQVVLIIGALCMASFLFLSNLGNQYLWQDEAQTALVSKTILTCGIPLGYDGKNSFSQEKGAELGANYAWNLHSWLQFYLVAAFFELFGVSTFTARLPFALFGMATVFLLYFFCKSMWKDKRAAVTAALLLLFCIPFIILSRQCRYYSLAAFFSLSSLFCYLGIIEKRKYSFIYFIASSTALFHSNYLCCATFTASVLIHSLVLHRNIFKKVAMASLVVALVNLPAIIWFLNMKYNLICNRGIFDINMPEFLRAIRYYLSSVIKYFMPPVILSIPVIFVLFKWIRERRVSLKNLYVLDNLSLLLIFCALTITASSIVLSWPFFRYLAPIIPPIIAIVSLILLPLMRFNIVAGGVLILMLICSNPIKEYFYEITHDYNGPIEGIVKYLNRYGRDTDVAAITYGDLPLKFYTKMKIVGGLTGEDLSSAKEAKWVIIRKYIISDKDAKVRSYLSQNVPFDRYKKIILDYPDTPFENREDPEFHNYKTVDNEDRVIIYQRIQ